MAVFENNPSESLKPQYSHGRCPHVGCSSTLTGGVPSPFPKAPITSFWPLHDCVQYSPSHYLPSLWIVLKESKRNVVCQAERTAIASGFLKKKLQRRDILLTRLAGFPESTRTENGTDTPHFSPLPGLPVIGFGVPPCTGKVTVPAPCESSTVTVVWQTVPGTARAPRGLCVFPSWMS